MITARQSLVEVLRALCVLGLIFLNFGHVPAAAASDLGVTAGGFAASVSQLSFCGDPSDKPGDHAPCHACRVGMGADLPPAPVTVAHPMVTVAVSYAASAQPALARIAWGTADARGPPALV